MQKKTTKILHLTPHLGGGVGRVLLSYLSKTKIRGPFIHEVASLDYANENATRILKSAGIALSDRLSINKQDLLEMIAKADVVLIHWWNHPLLYDFMVRTELPPCRIIIWSHISGFNPPYVFTKKILEYPERFVFVTPISMESEEVKELSSKQKKKLRVVLATSDVEQIRSIRHQKHEGFNVGYIGVVDYAKLHPDFLKICSKIKIPDIKFIVCGGPNEKEMEREAEKMGIAHKFEFTGPVPDITKYLSVFDIFGYPLSSSHYGACDQVLIESMAAGVPPIVLNNRMENNMIKNGKTGIVAKNKAEYIKSVWKLYKNEKMRNSLSRNAKKYSLKSFSLEKTIRDWDKIFKEVLVLPKTGKRWGNGKRSAELSASNIFLESLGKHGKNFSLYRKAKNKKERGTAEKRIKKMAKSPNWQSKTKGTIHHYHSFFPKDDCFYEWSRLMTVN